MRKLILFKKFISVGKNLFIKKSTQLDDVSVVVDKKNIPLGFVFGRDSFITFLEYLDSEFEKNVADPKKAFNNPAGKLIDFIEEKLPVKPKFIKDVKEARKEARKTGWVSFEEIERSLNV